MRQLLFGSTTTALAIFLLGSATVHADAPLIDFEEFEAGVSAETTEGFPPPIHDDLNIEAVFGEAKIIETGGASQSAYFAYFAPNSIDVRRENNCLEDSNGSRVDVRTLGSPTAKGFADPDAQQNGMAQEFDFTFADGVTVNKFSLKMFDYGDFLITTGRQSVILKGFDASEMSSIDGLSFFAETSSGVGDDGDACRADDDGSDPGYVKLEVQRPRMTRVELRVAEGLDSNVGFDSISFTRDDVKIDIKPGGDPNCFNVNGFGVIPVAILGSGALDVNDIDPDTLSFAGTKVRVKGNDAPHCAVEDVNGDGDEDLVCQFEDDPENWKPGTDEAMVTGNLSDGTPFEATDSICITREIP